MKKLDLNNTYIVTQKEAFMNGLVKIEIKEIYTELSKEGIKELEKKIDSLNRVINGGKDYFFQITTWYRLIKLSDFEVKYMPK